MEEEKSYQEIRKDAIEKYKKNVIPKIAKFERKRIDIKQKLKFRYTCGLLGLINVGALIAFVAFCAFCAFCADKQININIDHIIYIIPIFIGLHFMFFIFMGLDVLYCGINPFEKLVKEIKLSFMPLICSCFPNLKYVPNRKHSVSLYNSAKILPKYDKIEFDDCFEGKYKGVDFVIEEIKLHINTGNNNYYALNGLIMQFEMNKNFEGHTIIYPDYLTPSFELSGLHPTKMEDIVFEKKYNVYTNDDVEARYLITPSFIERLKEIKSGSHTDIFAAFYKKKIIIATSTTAYSDWLDNNIEINGSNTYKSAFYKITEEIISILKLIDHFKLDQNIGM